jgi:DNA modification methylase
MSGADAPELVWPGKYDAHGRRVPVPRRRPRIRVEERHRGRGGERGKNRLFVADNLACMDALLKTHAGAVDLCYIDPPFATGGSFDVVTRVGEKGEGGIAEVRAPAYSDVWEGGLSGFLSMLDPRLRMIHELLSPRGSLYLHVDPTTGHAVKLLADEIFGPQCFQREIVWRIGWVSGFKSSMRNWIRNHDLIFFYVKDPKHFTFNKHYVPYPEGYRRRDGSLPKGRGIPLDDVWNANESEFALKSSKSLDSIQIKSFSTEKTGYATQKNESVLQRIIEASSNPGDLVADFFCGSGTTLAVAQRLGRRFVGCDTSRAAVHIARKRLLGATQRPTLEVCSVRDEREPWLEALGGPDREEAHRNALLRHHGARPKKRDEIVHGRRGRSAVHVASHARPVDQAHVDRLKTACAKRGIRRLHLIAWEWDIEKRAAGTGDRDVDLVELGVQRRIMDSRCAARRDAALVERPKVQIVLSGLMQGRVVVEIAGYEFPHPRLLPADVRAATRSWSDFIDAWAVDWNEKGVFCPAQTRFRTHDDRELDLRAGPHRYRGSGPFSLVVQVEDVIGNRTHHLFAVARRGSGLVVIGRRER